MLINQIKDSEFFHDSGLTYEKDGMVRYFVNSDFILYHRGGIVTTVDQVEGSNVVNVYYLNGDVVESDLNMNITFAVYTLDYLRSI